MASFAELEDRCDEAETAVARLLASLARTSEDLAWASRAWREQKAEARALRRQLEAAWQRIRELEAKHGSMA